MTSLACQLTHCLFLLLSGISKLAPEARFLHLGALCHNLPIYLLADPLTYKLNQQNPLTHQVTWCPIQNLTPSSTCSYTKLPWNHLLIISSTITYNLHIELINSLAYQLTYVLIFQHIHKISLIKSQIFNSFTHLLTYQFIHSLISTT